MTVNLTRTNEGGSVASFAVVGIILVAIVIGGIYVVHRSGQNNTPAPSVSPTATTGGSPSATPPTTPKGASNSPVIGTPIAPGSPAPTSSPKPTTAPASPAPSKSPAPLPKTGPSDFMPGGIALGALVATAISYLRSRRVMLLLRQR